MQTDLVLHPRTTSRPGCRDLCNGCRAAGDGCYLLKMEVTTMNVTAFLEYLKSEFAPEVNNSFVWDCLGGFISDVLTQYDRETAIDVIYTCVPHIAKHVIIEFFYM